MAPGTSPDYKPSRNGNGWRTWLAVAATAVAILSTMAAFIGAPACNELVTKADAKDMHEPLLDKLDAVKEHNELDHQRIFEELKMQRTEISERLPKRRGR